MVKKRWIEWQQEDNNTLLVRWLNGPVQIYRAGTSYKDALAQEKSRTPAAHPEAT